MNDSTSPFFVALLFILRCAVPLAILFGISYLLRKMGLVAIESPEEPEEAGKDDNKETAPVSQEQTEPADSTDQVKTELEKNHQKDKES
jgi:hypothetical protein